MYVKEWPLRVVAVFAGTWYKSFDMHLSTHMHIYISSWLKFLLSLT